MGALSDLRTYEQAIFPAAMATVQSRTTTVSTNPFLPVLKLLYDNIKTIPSEVLSFTPEVAESMIKALKGSLFTQGVDVAAGIVSRQASSEVDVVIREISIILLEINENLSIAADRSPVDESSQEYLTFIDKIAHESIRERGTALIGKRALLAFMND